MKKYIFLLLLTIFTCITAKSQFMSGLKAGMNINNMIITNKQSVFEDQNLSTFYAFHFGSFVRSSFSSSFAWQLEVLYSRKGYKITPKHSAQVGLVKLDYINWPILIIYEANKNIAIEAGLEPGFLISGSDLYKNFDLGLDLGISYLVNNTWLIGLRYNQGFPFRIDNKEIEGETPRYQHSIVQLSLGYNFIKNIVNQDKE